MQLFYKFHINNRLSSCLPVSLYIRAHQPALETLNNRCIDIHINIITVYYQANNNRGHIS